MELLTNIDSNDIESLRGLASFGKTKRIISTFYRPPRCKAIFWSQVRDQIESVQDFSDENQIILGDLNRNYVFDENLFKNPIFKIEKEFDLKQLISSPTRCTEKSKTLLDVILTSDHSTHCSSGVVNCAISDHNLIYTLIRIDESNRSDISRCSSETPGN